MPSPTTSPSLLPAWLALPDHWPVQADLLHWCQSMHPLAAVLLIGLGLLYLMCGWYMFKVLLTLNATLIGGLLGAWIGQAAGSTFAGALLGAFITAVVTWPLMKHMVAVTGALFGGLIGASLWLAFGLEERYAPAGAAIGMIFFGLLSFIIFRHSVILYTSLQGAAMLIFGLLGIIYKIQDAAPAVTRSIGYKPFVLPMVIFIATILGQVWQQTHFPEEAEK